MATENFCIINIALIIDNVTYNINNVSVVPNDSINGSPYYNFSIVSSNGTFDLTMYKTVGGVWVISQEGTLTPILWSSDIDTDCPLGTFTGINDSTVDTTIVVSDPPVVANPCTTSFIPKIDLCIDNSCSSLCVKELTGVKQLPYNTSGWGSGNISVSDVVTSIVEIFTLDNTLLGSFALKDNTINRYPNNTPYPFSFNFPPNINTASDGIYKIDYTITTDTTIYKNSTQHSLFLCSLQNCLNKLIQRMIKECDLKKKLKDKEIIDQLEILMYAIKSSFACGSFETTTKLIADATLICENTGCGCKNCDC